MKVTANNTLSCIKVIKNGVPQGSVPSVPLFLIAIHDVLSNVTVQDTKRRSFERSRIKFRIRFNLVYTVVDKDSR